MVGAVIVLAGFVANQRFGLSSDSVWFVLSNAVGATVLAVAAGVGGDVGFLILEGVWAIVFWASLSRILGAALPLRSRRPLGQAARSAASNSAHVSSAQVATMRKVKP